MAKHPPEVYNPGELDRVRKNLGTVSPEEARRIASLLGGEVGVEKSRSPEAVRKHPQGIKARAAHGNSEQPVRRAAVAGHLGEPQTEAESSSDASRDIQSATLFKKPGFRDKIRKNFLASRKENRVKSFSESILSIFSFILPVPDNVHPGFIINSRKLFLDPIEEFVSSVRKVVSLKNEDFHKKLVTNPFYQKILQIVCMWDIEGLHKELSKLRLQPEKVQFLQCEKAAILLYRPYVLLHKLSVEGHIRKAIEFAFSHHIALIASENKAYLHKFFDTAITMLPDIFTTTREKCFPLFLKALPIACIEYRDFFRVIPNDALFHLAISPDDILKPEDALTVTGQTSSGEDHQENTTGEPGEDNTAANTGEIAENVPQNPVPVDHPVVIPPEARKGMEHLDKLFPDSGLARLENKPDLYPLLLKEFQSSFGTDLIPQDDPLTQVIFLHRILNELFYGLRSIEFGSFTGTGENNGMIEDVLEPILDIWPYFTDEILEKQYFPRLLEIQRQTERNQEFSISEYGRKISADLRWFRRLYLLPYQEIESAAGIRRASKLPNAPVLSETLNALKAIFSDINQDLENMIRTLKQQGVAGSTDFGCTTVHNPWAKYVFEIENPVSKRLSRLLVKKVKLPDGSLKTKDQRNNANLLAFTSVIIQLFDYLVNSEESYLYRNQPRWLFRQTLGDSKNPVRETDQDSDE